MLEKQNIASSKLIVILLVLWLVGVATSFTLGGFIHILLVVAGIAVWMRLMQRRDLLRERA